MFAKIFSSIFDSSIADDWQLRIVFQDLLVLADKDGVVDMTPAAISRRTNVPLDIVKERLAKLEAPDLTSRTPDCEGRRIIRLDPHRDWGWQIVNFTKYRESASKEMLRMSEADRKRAYRSRHQPNPSPKPPTYENEKQKQREKQTCPARVPDSPRHVPDMEREIPPVQKLSPSERISFEKELGRLAKELTQIGKASDYAQGSKTRLRIEQLTTRRSELQEVLGVVA